MQTPPRSLRLPALNLKQMLEARPFDRDAWMRACSADLHLRIANGPVCTERAAALEVLRDFLDRVGSFGCGFCEVWQRRETIYAETELDFIDAAGRLHRVPCVLVARTTHGLLHDIRIHLDPSGIPARA